jgi:hypothetical protein
MSTGDNPALEMMRDQIVSLRRDFTAREVALREERRRTKAVREKLGVGDLQAALARIDELLTRAAKVSDLEKQIAELPAPVTDGDKDRRITELQSALKTRDHRDTFRAAAAAVGVGADRVDDLYAVSGLKPGDDEPKPDDFTAFLETAKTAKAWAFTAPAGSEPGAHRAAPETEPTPWNLKPAAPPNGAGRGFPDNQAGALTVSKSRMSEQHYATVMQPKVAQAMTDGTPIRWVT